jgi:Domain of unknown function (DUF5053)
MKNNLEFKGFAGSIEFSLNDNCFFGKIIGINDLVSYEAQTVSELREAFEEAVNDYLQIKKTVKTQLEEIIFYISWAKISKTYFGKSRSWLYHKLDGVDGNGKASEFTEEEKETLQNALFDISDRIRKIAEKLV